MELFLAIYLFFNFLYNSLEVVPIWNLASSAIDLKPLFTYNKYSFMIFNKYGHDMDGKLKKELEIKGDEVTITNLLSIDGGTNYFEVPFDNIESVYNNILGQKIVCPRGKYHQYGIKNDNKLYVKIPDTDFVGKDYWDLKCYYHGANFYLVFYLINGKKSNYGVDLSVDKDSGSWRRNNDYGGSINDELFDFKLVYGNAAFNYATYDFYVYKMIGLIAQDNQLALKSYNMKFESKEGKRDGYRVYDAGSKVVLTEYRKYNQAYFATGTSNENDFYFISYNNVSDFTCGYSTYTFSDYHDLSQVQFILHSDSPFEFIDEVQIEQMNFLVYDRYVYYIIKNTATNEKYYGLFDVKLNKIMFNSNVAFDKFIPYSRNSILAIKGNSVYRICPIVDKTNSNNCIEDCTGDQVLIRDVDGNICGQSCPDANKYLLVPDNICDTTCDTSIYVVDEANKKCGLCKDMDTEKPYRFIGGTQCLSGIPEGAYEYNTKLKLLKCKSGYKTDESNVNACVTNCHSSCKTCSDFSSLEDDPKCLTCNEGYYLDNEKCLEIIESTVLATETSTPTIITNAPSTIITDAPTTMAPIPSTIITDAPTTMAPIPSTIITDAPTTMAPIQSTIITDAPTTMAPIPSSIITDAPTTMAPIQSTIIPVESTTITTTDAPTTVPVVCPDEKCLTCNEESNKLGLCLSCNEALGYKKVNYTLVLTHFLNCLKPSNPESKKYYYNETTNEYRPCYRTCKQCLQGGTAEKNFCLECETDYMFRPGNNPYNNCVAYSEFYYISSYNQYKSLDVYQCPEEAKYYIKKKKSCIDDCKKDNEYKYLYNGNCLKECPSGTYNNNYVCTLNENKCTLGKNELYLRENDNLGIIETLVRTYISEFVYMDNYVSLYENTNYTVMIYKNGDCIKQLNLDMPSVDFQSCYEKVQREYSITEKLIIVIVDKKEINNAKTFYSFYHPLSGRKLNADEICKNETIVVVESLNSVLDKNDTAVYEAQTSLTSQGVNIFDLNDPFYTDICYDFDNPMKKDIPLNDRIKTLYPDVELCDEGCQYKGINLEDMTSTCDCTFNDIANNELIKDNPLMESSIGQIFDIINSSNILVLKCFKNMFSHFSRSIGGWISLGLIISQTALSLIFFFFQSAKASKYIYNLTKGYVQLLSNKKQEYPPKRAVKNEKVLKLQTNSETKLKEKSRKNNNNKGDKNSADFIISYYDEKRLKTPSDNLNMKTDDDLISTEKNIEVNKEEIFDKEFFKEYMATSPEDMEFDDAVHQDKRKYCEHMRENLIEDQIITSAFIAEDPLKPRSIKIMVFILDVILYFVVNGLFFSEKVISELYNVNEEDENFFSYLPRSVDRLIYTTLVSVVLGIITDFFFVEEKKLKGILRREKSDIKTLKQKVKEFINGLKQRYFAFIIVVSIILIISFFYLLCFNYVYPYSQVEWIKSSITSFIIMQILSLLKCILETSMRFLSYKFNSEKLYKISKFLD